MKELRQFLNAWMKSFFKNIPEKKTLSKAHDEKDTRAALVNVIRVICN